MNGRGILGLLVALALGSAAGYAIAQGTPPSVTRAQGPTPVHATDPPYPTTPPESVKPDASGPPLSPTVPTRLVTLRWAQAKPEPRSVRVAVPTGWVNTLQFRPGSGQARWAPPGNVAASHSLRVRLLDEPQTPAQKSAALVVQIPLGAEIAEESFRVLSPFDPQTNTVEVTYIQGGYRKVQYSRWLPRPQGGTGVELSASGRTVDADGLRALLDRATASIQASS